MEKIQKKRLDNLDVMKAFAILAVLTLHAGVWNTDFVAPFSVSRLAQYACRLLAEGVPIFLMTNGYLLLRKNQLDLERHIRKMGKMVALILIWAAILTIVGNALAAEPEPFSVKMLLQYVFGTRVFAEYTGVLWFLQFLIAVYVVYPLLWMAYKNDFKIYQYIFRMLVFFVALASILMLLRDAVATRWDTSLLSTIIAFFETLSPFGSIFGGFVWYLFYFMLGGMIYHYEEQIRNRRVMWMVAGVLSWLFGLGYGVAISFATGVTYSASFLYNTGLFALCIMGLFALLLPYENKGNWVQRFIASVGENTFGIYLSHYLFLFICFKFWIFDSLGGRILEFIAVFMMSYLFSLVVGKIPYLKWLTEL